MNWALASVAILAMVLAGSGFGSRISALERQALAFQSAIERMADVQADTDSIRREIMLMRKGTERK